MRKVFIIFPLFLVSLVFSQESGQSPNLVEKLAIGLEAKKGTKTVAKAEELLNQGKYAEAALLFEKALGQLKAKYELSDSKADRVKSLSFLYKRISRAHHLAGHSEKSVVAMELSTNLWREAWAENPDDLEAGAKYVAEFFQSGLMIAESDEERAVDIFTAVRAEAPQIRARDHFSLLPQALQNSTAWVEAYAIENLGKKTAKEGNVREAIALYDEGLLIEKALLKEGSVMLPDAKERYGRAVGRLCGMIAKYTGQEDLSALALVWYEENLRLNTEMLRVKLKDQPKAWAAILGMREKLIIGFKEGGDEEGAARNAVALISTLGMAVSAFPENEAFQTRLMDTVEEHAKQAIANSPDKALQMYLIGAEHGSWRTADELLRYHYFISAIANCHQILKNDAENLRYANFAQKLAEGWIETPPTELSEEMLKEASVLIEEFEASKDASVGFDPKQNAQPEIPQ